MLNFCTLFDSAFLHYGLALHASLMRHCPAFHLYLFAFDEACRRRLLELKLAHVTVVSLEEFEDEDLLRIKPTRTRGEYCWTCASSTIRWCLKTFHLNHCTYLDADLYFYADPSPLLEELGEAHVSLISHRYAPRYDQSATSGIYCVQFMTFRNTPKGLRVLEWWRSACLEWCYNRMEDGKFGDQKYLDDWPERFAGAVRVLEHEGGGLAAWNLDNYSYADGFVTNIRTGRRFPLIFFHFHNVKNDGNDLRLGGYFLAPELYEQLYHPYLAELRRMRALHAAAPPPPLLSPAAYRFCRAFDRFKIVNDIRLGGSPVALLVRILYRNARHCAGNLLRRLGVRRSPRAEDSV